MLLWLLLPVIVSGDPFLMAVDPYETESQNYYMSDTDSYSGDWDCVGATGRYFVRNDCLLSSTVEVTGHLELRGFFDMSELPLVNNISRIHWDYGFYEHSPKWDNFTTRALTEDKLFKISSSNIPHFLVDSEGAQLILAFLILEGGSSDKGGSIYAGLFNDIAIQLTIFQNNHANFGGAIYVNGSQHPMLNGVSFRDNTATDAGGAIFLNVSRSVSYVNCTFKGNEQTSESGIGGGAIFLNISATVPEWSWYNPDQEGATIALYDSTLMDNTASTNKGHDIMTSDNAYIERIEMNNIYSPDAYSTNDVWVENNGVNNYDATIRKCPTEDEFHCKECYDVSLGFICPVITCRHGLTSRYRFDETFLPQLLLHDRILHECVEISTTQTWNLQPGWNGVAVSLKLSGDTKLNSVFSTGLFQQGDTILTARNGTVTYFPAHGDWSGGFYPSEVADRITLDECNSFKIKMGHSTDIELAGIVPQMHTFDFPTGWMWSGLPIHEDLAVSNFLQSDWDSSDTIWEEGDTILSANEGSLTYQEGPYSSSLGTWSGSWTHFKPGNLYKFKKASATQSRFPRMI